jgi:hypothetical protein
MALGGFVATDGKTKYFLGTGDTVVFQWAAGVDVELIRGVTDTDRTAIALRRSDGTKVYLYVDTGTTLVVSATAP